ncbi:mediator of RNA polymerase II transcription subunit 13 isoform X2 [Aristolochia californica]|uniref:mediator of RNA polymerase II transcription subunit 13 isoform X2 n=1 Tax=Aristolochia californica TaxID=171875 RepID=UPI0035E283A9
MWTNVFRIGGLQQVSWFQFLPCEYDPNTLPEKSTKAEQKDAATLLVLSAHLKLQNEGFLSTWTNSFVGPWDPSQGIHNPDEKIKLWLFLPGRYSSVVETAQAAVSRLRVVGAGLWSAPGDSEEVAAALSQALRNCIERALRGLSYMRFGDAFTKSQSLPRSETHIRRAQPICEFIFAATEEAIFVHAIIYAKQIRTLSSDDMERVLRHHSSYKHGEGIPVLVAPHGMRGRLSGCCPSDLVKQVYSSKVNSRSANGFTVLGIPLHGSAQSSNYQLRGQSCYVEVTLGCPNSKLCGSKSEANKGMVEALPVTGRKFIYPAEAVMVPLMYTTVAKSSLKRLWLQNCAGTSPFELWPLMNFPDSHSLVHGSKYGNSGNFESNATRRQHRYNSSSNSNSSSISSISSTSSDSDFGPTARTGDLETDADSLASRQSGLSTNDQLENDGCNLAPKRLRIGGTESFGQAGNVLTGSVREAYKSEHSGVEGNNSTITGGVNDQFGSHNWDWDNDDRGMDMDMRTLLSEFGDFDDFFQNDVLAFGEPPGTAESQVLMFPVDIGDISGSPCTAGMDVSDAMLLPPIGFPTYEGFSQPPPLIGEEALNGPQEIAADARSSCHSTATSSGEFDHLTKVEAMLTFASEYTAVQTPASEFPASIFRSPYLPKSQTVDTAHSSSNVYVYGVTPPSSPLLEVSNEKPENISAKAKVSPIGLDSFSVLQLQKCYTHVLSAKQQQLDRQTDYCSQNMASCKGEKLTSPASAFNSSSAVKSLQRTKAENTVETLFLVSHKTVLATEVECIMFQAAMCRIRHIPIPSVNIGAIVMKGVNRNTIMDQSQYETSIICEVKKKETIPVRIAGDIDGGVPDGGTLNAPVGVWRSVGLPKGTKFASSPNFDGSLALSQNVFNDEGIPIYGQRQPLQDLLDAMGLLVQQATSFVDVSLDTDRGDGPYGWLALQEQQRRGFACGPSMVHAGCGGLLAACHSLDIAGVELLDPLSADVHASSVIGLLQADIKVALKSAFGNLDGPLSITEWCKGRNQSGDTAGISGDGYSLESTLTEAKDTSSSVTLASEPISPPQSSTSGSSFVKDGSRLDEGRINQELCGSELEQINNSRLRPTLMVVPLPSILVGYQDDWLKTSASSLQLWEKAPLEPYALSKPMTYCVVCPDIGPLMSATADFFQQLGTVYESCKLGSHLPHQVSGGQTEVASGFCLVDCPHNLKATCSNLTLMGSVSEFVIALSKGWDVRNFLVSLSKVVKALKVGLNSAVNQKEGGTGSCLVIYVVCPFPEPTAILQTLVESSVALGSSTLSSDKDRALLHSQVGKAFSCTAGVDETSISSILTLSGFSVPRLVLQIVTIETIFVNELSLLKDIAFTVYNKARRVPRTSSSDMSQSSGISGRTQSAMMNMPSSMPGLWKDCMTSRITASTPDLDAGLRPGTWDNSWQTSRTGGLSCESNRSKDFLYQEEVRYLFEPLFILAEPGSVDHGVSIGHLVSESPCSRPAADDNIGGYMQNSASSTTADMGPASLLEGSETDSSGSNQRSTSLHCCYGWTEDWRWLVCIWTDSRGELLDSNIFPFGGISSRQDTKGLQGLFVQVLQQGCQILSSSSPDGGTVRPRDIVITRIGCFYELECQEWQKAIYFVGGNEVKKWPIQLRRSIPDGVPSGSNGTTLQQQDMSLIQERTLPSSPSPSLYSPHSKPSGFIKGSLGQSNSRKQHQVGGQAGVDISRGLLQWVQSISLVGLSVDHSLHLVFPADSYHLGGGAQSGLGITLFNYLEGFSPVKSLGATPASYILIPSPSMRFLPPVPLQLPTCLTAESPPLAHLLHSKGSAIPLSTGFVVSKSVPSVRRDFAKDEWPSVLSVSLVDYYGASNLSPQEKMVRGVHTKQARVLNPDTRDYEMEIHMVLESVSAELHALSWMTVSPAYLDRRTALPFHCDMVLRLRRLLHYADKQLCQSTENQV